MSFSDFFKARPKLAEFFRDLVSDEPISMDTGPAKPAPSPVLADDTIGALGEALKRSGPRV